MSAQLPKKRDKAPFPQPIHDGRILRDDGRTVVIRIQDYRRGCERQLAMPGEEFVARFVFHILPRRMQRVRFAGLFQPNVRKRRVALCHRLLATRDMQALGHHHVVRSANRPASGVRARRCAGRFSKVCCNERDCRFRLFLRPMGFRAAFRCPL